MPAKKRVAQLLETLLADEDARAFLQVNRYNEIDWYNKEAFEQLLWGLFAVAVDRCDCRRRARIRPKWPMTLVAVYDVIAKLQDAKPHRNIKWRS